MKLPFQRIAILGLGLIGSSLARALSEKMPGLHIAAFDISPEALAYAMEHGFIHSSHMHAGQAVQQADIVVLATSVVHFASLAADMATDLKAGATVTDTGSVKRDALSSITFSLPSLAHYVPGHPIAGSEQTGIKAGSADLFAGKRVILTPAEAELLSEPVARVRLMWEMAGAQVEFMPADLHDRIYAYVSHLPQLVAFALKPVVKSLPPPESDSYRRFTRLMKSDLPLWVDIFMANADYLGEALADFTAFLSQMHAELSERADQASADAPGAADYFPPVIATCLIACAAQLQEAYGVHPARYAGSGFADMTAPAEADPEATLAAISSHPDSTAHRLKDLLNILLGMTKALADADREKLLEAIAER